MPDETPSLWGDQHDQAHRAARIRRAVFCLLLAAPVLAQATGELAGRVTDESGGVLPGVTVTATQTDTGFVRTVVTDAEGQWVMPNMPTGPYRLEVMLQGFRAYVQTGIVLQVGATLALSKVIGFGTAQTLELRAEAFNLLNHFNWGNPGTNLNAGTFGRVQSLAGTPPNNVFGTPRILQFGVKYGF